MLQISAEQIGLGIGTIAIIVIIAGYKVYQSYSTGLIRYILEAQESVETSRDDIIDEISGVSKKMDRIDDQTDRLQSSLKHVDKRVEDVDDRLEDLGYAVYEIHKTDKTADRELLRHYTGVENSPSDLTRSGRGFTRSHGGDITPEDEEEGEESEEEEENHRQRDKE